MRKLFALLFAAALCATTGGAQPASSTWAGFAGLLYDVDGSATTFAYCSTQGPNNTNQLIMSSGGGSSANLVPSVASSGPFLGMAAGDVLSIRVTTTTWAYRKIMTWTSANAVTVDSAITLAAGVPFVWYRNTCGTTVTDGWFNAHAAASRIGITVQFEQGDIDALQARWECRHSNTGDIVVIYPGQSSDCGLGGTLATDRCEFLQATAGTATGSLTIVDDAPVFDACRVGLAFKTTDTDDATTNLEKVTVSVSIR